MRIGDSSQLVIGKGTTFDGRLEIGSNCRVVIGDGCFIENVRMIIGDGAEVWTGSTNWTDDSWSRQENVVVEVASTELAEAYSLAFGQLWDGRPVADSGRVEPRRVDVGGSLVRPWFCPG